MLATKFGNERGADGSRRHQRRPEYVRAACERASRGSASTTSTSTTSTASTRRPDRGDGRRDGRAGRGGQGALPRPLRGGAETIRRAHAVHPITRAPDRVLALDARPRGGDPADVRELGIGFVAYSPLGRGFLTGQIPQRRRPRRGRLPAATRASRARTSSKPRAGRRGASARRAKGVTAAQLALAWVLARGDDVVPIPGTKRRALPRGERRRARDRADGRGASAARRGVPRGRRRR